MTTYVAKPSEIKKDWYLIDATDLTLGRVASKIAMILRGKHKPTFTPNIDTGDFVVVINADKIHLSGKKLTDKNYYWHTGYPGGIKSVTAGKLLDGQFPERVLFKAVERMVPRTPLGKKQMTKLKVFAGENHDHAAQNPVKIDFGSENPKNVRRS